MGVRLRHQQAAGLKIAEWLQRRPEVKRVMYPALPDDPGHAIWKRDFTGACSLFGVVLHTASQEAVARMVDGFRLFKLGASWGGYESLIVPFDCSSYRTATTWNPEGPALRLHIGLEHVQDLKSDLAAGFERMSAA